MTLRLAAAALAAAILSACGGTAPTTSQGLVVGVLLPISGASGALAQEELNGIRIATDELNRRGGAFGQPVRLEIRDATTREGFVAAVDSLKGAGAHVVLGGYESVLSIPAAHAANADGLVYWETGAVADQLTGEGLPMVFRVGAAGTNLGSGSAAFAAEQLAPRLHKAVSDLRVTIVEEDDAYGNSVAAAAQAEAAGRGMQVVDAISYNVVKPDWNAILDRVSASHPDVLVLASYIPDGVAFRRAMLGRHLQVGALIGSTMAECGPIFGQLLGADAIGVFASDRPTRGFNPAVLTPAGSAAYRVLVDSYHSRFSREPGEEAISGFSAAWALMLDVLPHATTSSATSISAAARAVDLPAGALPNGGGLKFGTDRPHLGQNLRAASVVWQWQGVNRSVTVWPAVFATGEVEMVPLPR